jgi:hypothetical protein
MTVMNGHTCLRDRQGKPARDYCQLKVNVKVRASSAVENFYCLHLEGRKGSGSEPGLNLEGS